MKVVLDLKHSFNNYDWNNSKELEEHIYNCLNTLWKYYQDNIQEQYDASDEEYIRFYDLLDMFSSFDIINENKIQDAEKQKYIDIIDKEYKPKIREKRDNLSDDYSISEYDSVYQDILDYEDNRYEDFETKKDFDEFIFYLKELVK